MKKTNTIENILEMQQLQDTATKNHLVNHYKMYKPTLDAIKNEHIDLEKNLRRVTKNMADPDYQNSAVNEKATDVLKVFKEDAQPSNPQDVIDFYDKVDAVVSKLNITSKIDREGKMKEITNEILTSSDIGKKCAESNLKMFKEVNGDINQVSFEYHHKGMPRHSTYDDYVTDTAKLLDTENYSFFLSFTDLAQKEGVVTLLAFEHHLALGIGFSAFIGINYCLHENGVFKLFSMHVAQKAYHTCTSLPYRIFQTTKKFVYTYRAPITFTVLFTGGICNYNNIMKLIKPAGEQSIPKIQDFQGYSDLNGYSRPIQEGIKANMQVSYLLGQLFSGLTTSFIRGSIENNQVTEMGKESLKQAIEIYKDVQKNK